MRSILSRRKKIPSDFFQFIVQVGFYCCLILTGYMIGISLPNGDRTDNISIYNNIEIDKNHMSRGPLHYRKPRKVKVLCYIITSPTFLWKRAFHVKQTWGSRCDKTLYFSSVSNHSFPAIGLNVSEGREHLTAKSHLALRYIYKHFYNRYDWFLKADDNTYVIVENLNYFLRSKDRNDPLFFGHHFASVIEGGYASGGAGYVLSREALRRLADDGTDNIVCRQDGGAEDVEIAKCLHNLGVVIGDSFDNDGKSLFHCFDPASHLIGNYPEWYLRYDAGGAMKGRKYMSQNAISFHYIKPEAMYAYDYFLYHVKINE